MIPTAEQQREIAAADKVRDQIATTALENARFHERALLAATSSNERQRHVGAIDAYAEILRTIDPNTDWLAHIRATA